MKFGDLTAETVETHAPRYADLAGCYDVTPPALMKLGRKYGLSINQMANPETVLKTLLRYGDRRGVLVRRLSDPKILDAVWDEILELEYYPL